MTQHIFSQKNKDYFFSVGRNPDPHISDIVLGNSAVSVACGQAGGGFKDSIFVWSFVVLFLLRKSTNTELP